MNCSKRWVGCIVLAICLSVGGCKTGEQKESGAKYSRPLPQGQMALRKVTNAEAYPDFLSGCYDLQGLRMAISNSVSYLRKPSSRRYYPSGSISHGRALKSLEVFAELLDSGIRGQQLETVIKERFEVYESVGWDGEGTVLFTGYYTPIFEGSLKRMGRFQYPLYSMPDDLVKGAEGEILGRRGGDGLLRHYPARAEIEASGILAGLELLWLGDPFEVYICHVQGSAKIQLPGGDLITVGYAANNGWDYHSISEELIAEGVISRDQMNLERMINYFKQHKEQVAHYVRRNPRFVFFQPHEGPPRGSLNEPVTAIRSVATDKSIFPRGSLGFVSTQLPEFVGRRMVNRRYNGFVLDHDTGGAIRAPGRCDIYMGQGILAGKRAGHVYQEGRLYYLFLKPKYMGEMKFAATDGIMP